MTDRAEQFLQKSERKDSIRDKARIVSILEKYNVDYHEPIIDFQHRFGGLVFYHGLEPICWGIQHPSPRGEFKYMNKEIITFESEGEYPEFSLLCADTLSQIRWTIDERGAIFEDFEILANTFDKVIEDFAMWEDVMSDSKNEVWKRNFQGRKLGSIISSFDKVEPVKEIQEPGIKWFKVDNEYYLTERGGEILFIGPTRDDINAREKLLERVK